MKSARVVVVAALVVACQVMPARAGTLLLSAERLARQAGQQAVPPASASVRQSATGQQSTPGESGMSRRKKVLIVVFAAVATAGAMYAIDHGVVDNTPSSKGTRKD